jgi:hypothetical protein
MTLVVSKIVNNHAKEWQNASSASCQNTQFIMFHALEHKADCASSSSDNSDHMHTLPEANTTMANNSTSIEDTLKSDEDFNRSIQQKFGSEQMFLSYVPLLRDRTDITFLKNKRKGFNSGYYNNEHIICNRFVFESSQTWAPKNINVYDEIPYNIGRTPKIYGRQSFTIIFAGGTLYKSGCALFSNEFGHRYKFWLAHVTTCWSPIKEYILWDTLKGVNKDNSPSFIIIKGSFNACTSI